MPKDGGRISASFGLNRHWIITDAGPREIGLIWVMPCGSAHSKQGEFNPTFSSGSSNNHSNPSVGDRIMARSLPIPDRFVHDQQARELYGFLAGTLWALQLGLHEFFLIGDNTGCLFNCESFHTPSSNHPATLLLQWLVVAVAHYKPLIWLGHVSGLLNPTDFLSRHPCSMSPHRLPARCPFTTLLVERMEGSVRDLYTWPGRECKSYGPDGRGEYPIPQRDLKDSIPLVIPP